MPFAYVVRCNFSRPDLEEAWNDWYSGPKIRDMLKKPLFHAGQRFAADGLDTRRKFLALWIVDSPTAFQTPEYTSDWGFYEWAPHITDWSRDLYRLPDGLPVDVFRIADGERLHLLSLDGVPEADAPGLMETVEPARPGMRFLEIAGIDRHSPRLGLARLAPGEAPPAAVANPRVQETLFRPISAFLTAASVRAEAERPGA
jgi:hypothetical protein